MKPTFRMKGMNQINNNSVNEIELEIESELQTEWDRLGIEYPGSMNANLRISMLKSYVMRMMVKAKSMDQVKDIYIVFLSFAEKSFKELRENSLDINMNAVL